MDSKGKPTPEKKDQVRKDTEVELSVEELEERIAPTIKKPMRQEAPGKS